MSADENAIPDEYRHLTLRDIFDLYSGPNRLPVPPALAEWVQVAELLFSMLPDDRAAQVAALRSALGADDNDAAKPGSC